MTRVTRGLLKTFDLDSKLVQKVFKDFRKTQDTFRIEREDKINLYKEEKCAKAELEKLEKENDKLAREVHLRQFDALNMWLYFPMEKKMMRFRNKLEEDPEARDKFQNRHKGKDKKKKPLEVQYMKMNPDGSMGKTDESRASAKKCSRRCGSLPSLSPK